MSALYSNRTQRVQREIGLQSATLHFEIRCFVMLILNHVMLGGVLDIVGVVF